MQASGNQNLKVFMNPAHQPWAYCLDDYTVTLLRVQKPIAVYRYCFCDHLKLGNIITRIFETIPFSSHHTTKKFFTNCISEVNPHDLMVNLIKPGCNLTLRVYEFDPPCKFRDSISLTNGVEVEEKDVIMNMPRFLSQESSGSEADDPVPNEENANI